ncbi:MAG: Uma2 family endonuclease [Microcystis sp. M090S1]|jgi:Uma2 family endonuclease|uniref:Uma2 family endonuclease n=1 Tax=Microcystis sp. M090S1 TaxID=2771135 RepID=UPI0025870F70|nr:Uma2 family endonuclease [Microcystis sp. M090S1]MCA2814212.1 Uma2 family endonuclease [Microcystis sp. M090S1]
MQLALEQIIVNPGQQLLLKELNWQKFETILSELGESRASRLSYSNGILEIMVPLPEHEKDKEIISYMVQFLLEALNIDFEPLGSTTFKNERMNQAVEPDACFYIKNYQAVIGKNRLNLESDPPPDLVLEIDITSRTYLDNYRQLGVPELWRYTQSGLQINLLQEGEYIESLNSPNFPQIPIIELINQSVKQSQQLGRSEAIRNFKNWLTENIDNS